MSQRHQGLSQGSAAAVYVTVDRSFYTFLAPFRPINVVSLTAKGMAERHAHN